MEKSAEKTPRRERHSGAERAVAPTAQPAAPNLPLVPLKNTVIFPGAVVTLNIGREKSIEAIKEANAGEHRFIAATQREAEVPQPGPDDVFGVGSLVEIKQYEPQTDGTIQLVVTGVARARIAEWVATDPFLRVEYHEMEEPTEAGAQSLAPSCATRIASSSATPTSAAASMPTTAPPPSQITEPGKLADILAVHVVTDHLVQQDLLETLDPLERLEKLCVTLGNEIEILELENKIRQKVRQQVDKNQREYYLKEQLRAIQEELGHDQASEIAELREKIAAKGLNDEVATKVAKELDRLERMPAHSAELVVLRNYIDWILALPWSERSEDRLDMKYAQRVLDEDHFGLEKVKERIIEFLAVRQLRMLQAQRQQTPPRPRVTKRAAKQAQARRRRTSRSH